MKIVGIIAEYNPFHNGHFYHIQKAKEITGADATVIVMSGDYVQRGAPAILPKHLRAQMALSAGADVVLELPVCYAAGSAEYFASGSIALLQSLGCIDAICFGSECGDISFLKCAAEIFLKEPDDYKQILQKNLRSGLSFPKARQLALETKLADRIPGNMLKHAAELPNNILGIEYLKALLSQESPIKPYTIRRISSGYHDTKLSGTYSSASAIRKALAEGNLFSLNEQMPENCVQILKESWGKCAPVHTDDLSLLLKYRLMQEDTASLTRYADVSAELANRIINNRNHFISFGQFCELLKTKEITYTRISRCLIHILLNITEDSLTCYKTEGMSQYARLLGFRKDRQDVLSQIKSHATVPLITKLTQAKELSPAGKQMLEQDIQAADLYESIITDKYKTPFINEYQKQVIKF